jgi:hypothetical protein
MHIVLTLKIYLGDYSHTLIVSIIILYFWFYTYCTSDLVNGLDGMYKLLQQAGIDRPVAGNQDGSYLTLKSNCKCCAVHSESKSRLA